MFISNIQQSKNRLSAYFDFDVLFSGFCGPEVMLLSTLRVNSVSTKESPSASCGLIVPVTDGVQQLLS